MIEVCDICGGKLETHYSAPERTYHYTESGVDVVYLVGVEVFACPTCNAESAAIPDIEGLHRLIAVALLSTPEPLAPREFMFLRKEARLGLPELSERSGVGKEVFKAYEMFETPSLRKSVTLAFDRDAKTWGIAA